MHKVDSPVFGRTEQGLDTGSRSTNVNAPEDIVLFESAGDGSW